MNEHDSINTLDEHMKVIDDYFLEIKNDYEKEPDKAFVSLMQASIIINQILSTFSTGLIRRASQSLQFWLQKVITKIKKWLKKIAKSYGTGTTYSISVGYPAGISISTGWTV